jgi:small multidrug resistance family-3 protein
LYGVFQLYSLLTLAVFTRLTEEYLFALSILWGWKIDRVVPDKFDIIGGLVALVSVSIIMYWPRPQ